MTRLAPGAAIVLAASLCAGCAGSSDAMREIASPSAVLAAPADRAVVVFVRPSGMAFLVSFAIVDGRGAWLGDAVSKSRFAVSLPAGQYVFAAWGENTSVIHASLAAGRIYYVAVSPAFGWLTPRVDMEALSPRSDDWSELATWTRDTKLLEPLPMGAARVDGDPEERADRVEAAAKSWDDLGAEDKEAHTLHADDGVPGTTR